MITLTDLAYEKALNSIKSRDNTLGLRVGVRTAGCSGLAYVLEFVEEIGESDEVFEIKDVKIVIDKKSLVYLDGLEMDWKKQGLNEGFEFNNPNANGECGCGESFTV
jgi:iron-sulfur cluster assembly protein